MTARSTPSAEKTDHASDTVLDLKREIKRCPECAQHFGADARFCPFDGTMLESQAWDGANDSLLGGVIDGRYEVCAVLGEGGMGTVYKVRHMALDRMFAMKVLRKDLARDGDLAARFTQEARATALVKHPNIVQITDFGHIEDGVPYFVMELLVGQPLSAALKASGPLPLGVACRLILKIAGALGAAHEAGIVHRDMKPENVFLLGRGPEGSLAEDLRIVDFGAAKIMGSSRITKTGIVFGTPHFMSPEQASGGVVDHRSDIYSLGIIMYEIFTGRVPFEADTYMGVLTQHMFIQPTPPSTVSANAKDLGALEGVILRALEKKPEARFASMEELAAEIRRHVEFLSSGDARVVDLGAEGAPRSRAPRAGSPRQDAESEPRLSLEPPPGRSGAPLWLFGIAAGAVAGLAALGLWAVFGNGTAKHQVTPVPSVPPALSVASPPAGASGPAPSAWSPSPGGVSLAGKAGSAAASAPPPPVATAPRRGPAPPPASTRSAPPDPEFVDPWKKGRP